MEASKSIFIGMLLAFGWGKAHAGNDHIRIDPVLEWNEIMVAQIAEQPPTLHTRLGAMMHIAVFEAVNKSLRGASAHAAVVSAAHGVLRANFPDGAAELDAARERSLSRVPPGPGKREGIAIGEAAAAAILEARTGDGSEAEEFHTPASTEPGVWQLTAGCPPAGGVFPHWRKVRPFALRRADQFRSVPPPALGSNRYAQAFNEVKENGGRDSTSRPQHRTDIARFYAVVGDGLLWNPVARQIAAARRQSLAQNARAFALLNIALADAAIAVTETKYHYNTWRPETAIPAAATDGNDGTEPQASFAPLIETPCFPAYPSGHATLSYAAREVLEHIFGTQGHTIELESTRVPQVKLRYRTLEEITTDVDDSRVYGGIHFRFDQTAGASQGRAIGEYVVDHALGKPCPCKKTT
jgi:hypothetical protein